MAFSTGLPILLILALIYLLVTVLLNTRKQVTFMESQAVLYKLEERRKTDHKKLTCLTKMRRMMGPFTIAEFFLPVTPHFKSKLDYDKVE